MHVVFDKSPIAGKKMRATFYSDKTMQDKIKHTDFGAQGYRDYTLMSDKDNVHYIPDLQERLKIKSLYQMRHRNDNIRDPTTAGALSFFVLWNKSSIKSSVNDYAKRFKKSGISSVKINQ